MKELSDIIRLVGDLGTPIILLFILILYFGKKMDKQGELLQNIDKSLAKIYEFLKISNNKKDE